MEETLRRLERQAAIGSQLRHRVEGRLHKEHVFTINEAEVRLYREKNKLGMIPPGLTAEDMGNPTTTENNLCDSFGSIPVCGCFYDPCELCDSGFTDPCPGCWSCLAPSIYFGYRIRTIEWIGNCLYGYSRAYTRPWTNDYVFCGCTYCERFMKFEQSLSTLRVLRMIERSVSK